MHASARAVRQLTQNRPMKSRIARQATRAAWALAAIAAASCGSPPIAGSSSSRQVDVDGFLVWVAPMPERNSWGATRYGLAPFVQPNAAIEAQRLREAIRRATVCRVVSDHYNAQTANLFALVDCG